MSTDRRPRPPSRRTPGPRPPASPPERTDQRAVERPERPDATTGRNDRIAIAAVVVLSAVLHLWKLGYRPLAHDEAIDAWFSWQARDLGVMKYDPVYHGPLRFYLEGLGFHLFGTGATAARMLAALAGIAGTAVIATRRNLLGRVGAPAAALLFTVSPTVLTVTRTGREDSLTGLVSLGMLLIVADALQRGTATQRHLVAMGALLATSFTLKETTFIFGFAGACFFVLLGIAAWGRDGAARRFYRSLGEVGWQAWAWTILAFLAVFSIVFTSLFRYPEGFADGLTDGIEYWLSQHSVGRGSQKWHFYLTILVFYEWLIVGLAVAGGVFAWRRRDPVGGWLATMAIVQLVVYTWAGEKFAWLMLHPVIPAVLLAGRAVQQLWNSRPELVARRLLAAGLALTAAGTLVIAVRPAITHGDDTRELLVTVQTTRRVHDLAADIRAGHADGSIREVLVDSRDSGSWPWVWYLHELPGVAWVTIDPSQPLPMTTSGEPYDVYIVSANLVDPAPEPPEGFTIEQIPLRGWWLPEWGNASLGDVARWFFTRQTWNPTGTSDQYVIRRG